MHTYHLGYQIWHGRNMRSPLKWWVKMPDWSAKFRTRKEAIEFIERQVAAK